MRLVILESPYGSDDPAIVARNERYGRACLRDSLLRGEAPLAPHLLYTQEGVLDDRKPEERALGIEAGLAWGVNAEATVLYADMGVTDGMQQGNARASIEGRPVEFRLIGWKDDCQHEWRPCGSIFDMHMMRCTQCGAERPANMTGKGGDR